MEEEAKQAKYSQRSGLDKTTKRNRGMLEDRLDRTGMGLARDTSNYDINYDESTKRGFVDLKNDIKQRTHDVRESRNLNQDLQYSSEVPDPVQNFNFLMTKHNSQSLAK